jgi:hypothetical protein
LENSINPVVCKHVVENVNVIEFNRYATNGQPEWKRKYENSRIAWILQLKEFRKDRDNQIKQWQKNNIEEV